ncbi:MAG: hypothetical protein Kow00109_03900 [Acidobacteriota bacterium]
MWEQLHPGHVAVVFGGAVAGAEVVDTLTARGVYCVVVERAALPWGKIEWGLPKWHVKQRQQEEALIDAKMDHPYVEFVPNTELGRDVTLEEVLRLPVSAVFLAIGAWKDRPLPIPGIDEFVGKGLAYQNPFVAWYNETPDACVAEGEYRVEDGAVVIGGGLASLDVAKILMLETTRCTLRRLGHDVDLVTLEKKGIPKTLEQLGLEWKDLGLKGCTLYYRRRAEDMPLVPVEGRPTGEQLAQLQKIRVKVLETARSKYLFHFEPCCVPVDKIVEDGRLVGLVFQRTEVVEGKARPLPGTEFPVRAPLVVSSIGSIPEPIPGVPMESELYVLEDDESCRVKGYRNVFAVGNAVTGTGNIRNSRLHARRVAHWVLEHHLAWREADWEQLRELLARGDRSTLGAWATEKGLRSEGELAAVLEWARQQQQRVGYDGHYRAWIERVRGNAVVGSRD